MAVIDIRCPQCNGRNVVRYGKQPNGKQRYLCQDPNCPRRIFLLDTPHETALASMPTAMRQVLERALSGNDIEETARELRLPATTVAEVFQVLARFNAPPAGVTRNLSAPRRKRASG
ncbi:MAG: hypothetical protein HQM03_15475 [Magnetococcales bacterium]|nr:hypothetical protein [Magnetococcales bacterium]